MDTREIFNVYFPGLIMFTVFSFANELLKKLVFSYSLETMLLTILWIALIIQITYAYTRGLKYKDVRRPDLAVIASGLEIICVIYMCSIMGGYENTVMPNYLHLTVPFIGIVFSQFTWFVFVRSFDVPALFRLSFLFMGMVVVSIVEKCSHNIWNLVAIDVLIVFLGILRMVNKAPSLFTKIVTKIWVKIKSKYSPQIN